MILLTEIEQYFSTHTPPPEPMRMDASRIIINHPKYIEATIRTLKYNYNKPVYMPYYNRLVAYYNKVKGN
jgi:hypothetical protein